jgi:glycosyltransferase involved in cell wall biosynthesis/GT2 family glycosyltransferase
MFEKLPSLRGFQPKFYVGGPMRFHLPLLHDLVASARPKLVVTLGWSDAEGFFTVCQALDEQGIEARCIAIQRDDPAGSPDDDQAWREGKDYGDEFYGDRVRFFESAARAFAEVADGAIDLLIIDDCDSGTTIGSELRQWEAKLAPEGVVLVHGIGLERDDSPGRAWEAWLGDRKSVNFQTGIGLAVACRSGADPLSRLLSPEISKDRSLVETLGEFYAVAAERIDAQGRLAQAERASAALEIRQVWLDSLLQDRWKAQEIMDHQGREIAHQGRTIAALQGQLRLTLAELEEQKARFENLHRDRVKAQLVMDSQQEQLKKWAAETEILTAKLETLKAQVKDQKQILNAAKNACRRKGKCFQVSTGPKVKRPLMERVAREFARLPRNLRGGRSKKPETAPEQPLVAAPRLPVDRYAVWIAENEPDPAALDLQRSRAAEFSPRVKISLLTPVHNTPGNFLEEMFESVAAQTYDNWELCVVDAASDRAETIETLARWETQDDRIHVERLEGNFGIAENTNRALQMATGDFVACLDHDDLLAPFALYEFARAAAEFPEADIFYSDEDRLTEKGKRHSPFFKPEWSPELLVSFMYIGHLSAYRRALALELDGFRKEYDMSQDYDFALRATERARSIHHVPQVLYHWREHPSSGSTGGKPGARKTNLAALEEAMRRRNLPAEIIEYPTANRARLQIESWPRVSVIVPTDSPTRAQACLRELPAATRYPDLEIVLVTNSRLADTLKVLEPENATVRLVPYDAPFNFSDKCNRGADASTGERLIFFNDDVETSQADWIQNVIEPLENPEVGAVSPKLLYETGNIQHAGLVVGVRGLIGTAFHQRPADSTEHVNLAQSLRDVAALSAACLAMRRADFFKVGGFDSENTPIAHSDVDLCFKVREAGLRCVYTPFATLRHAGHVSIGAEEKAEPVRRKDKAALYLLRRWAHYTTHDPYFPDNMRDWLHTDSPTPIRMSARDPSALDSHPDLLFISHDLSLSGAPILLLQLVLWCQENGSFVVVMAPEDGPLRAKYEEAGVPLILDPLIMTGHESFVHFAANFDCVIANTIRGEPAVRSARAAKVPVIWWVHETEVGEHFLREDAKLRSALGLANIVLAPSERTASVYRPFREQSVECSYYGIPDVRAEDGVFPEAPRNKLRFLVLGSIEPRKGQDIFLKAIAALPIEERGSAEFHLVGRVMDPEFGARIQSAAAELPNVFLDGPCDHAEALNAIRRCDVLVCSSRDETMPVTILEALSLGKGILSADVGGIGEVVADGHSALLVKPEDPDALAAGMQRLLRDRGLLAQLGRNARETFEKNFTQDRFGADFLRLVSEAMAGSRTPSSIAKAMDRLAGSSSRLLLVSHDLSLSGAPMMLAHAARWCRDHGIFVVVLSPRDGPLGEELKAAGVPLVVDPSLGSEQAAFGRFARGFDCVVVNTIRGEEIVRATLSEHLPVVWWLHEPASVGGHLIRKHPGLSEALGVADLVISPAEEAAAAYAPFVGRPVKCLRNAIPDIRADPPEEAAPTAQFRFLLLGSIEPRKGQDVFVEAVRLLPGELTATAEFQIAGRILDLDFWKQVREVAAPIQNLSTKGALTHAAAIRLMREADVVVFASRDEAMPTITLLEAMSLGKTVIATTIGSTGEVLVDGENALLVAPEAADQLAAAMRRCLEDRALTARLGSNARAAYEDNFTMERFGPEFREAIEQVISRRTSALSART